MTVRVAAAVMLMARLRVLRLRLLLRRLHQRSGVPRGARWTLRRSGEARRVWLALPPP
jgi:hypothetical protein